LLALAFSRSLVLIAAAEALFGFTMNGNNAWFIAWRKRNPRLDASLWVLNDRRAS
jgi:hypothetical protein